MERLRQRLATATQALGTLTEVVARDEVTALMRDAAIQRFEYSFETTWKALQLFLREQEGIDAGSPKAVIRASLQANILDEMQARTMLQMVDDRNLTVHTYNEALANLIYNRLKGYGELIAISLTAMRKRLQNN